MLRTDIFSLTAARILKGCSVLRMCRGAGCCGCRNKDYRKQPPATDFVPGTYLVASTFDTSFIIQRKNSITKWPIQVLGVILHPLSNPHLVHFLFQVGLRFALCYIALSYLGPHNELTFVGYNFLKLAPNVSLLCL